MTDLSIPSIGFTGAVFAGLSPGGAPQLSHALRQAHLAIDEIDLVLSQATALSQLELARPELWALQEPLATGARSIDNATDRLVAPTLIPAAGGWAMWLSQRWSEGRSRCDPDGGDVGGYLSARRLAPVDIDATEGAAARALAAAALLHTGSKELLAPDEFGVITLDPNGTRVVLVLPGVTDLTLWGADPTCAVGPHPIHRSLRDLDQGALWSWQGTNADSNPYAQAVIDWVGHAIDAGSIAKGASVMVVGHSYGSDTALDLASTPTFNGEMVNITHVVAAGYDNEPHFDHVPDTTEVLSLENRLDVPAMVESVGDHLVTTLGHVVNPAAGVAGTIRAGLGLFTRRDHITKVDFNGGFVGWGHDPENYLEFIERTDDERIADFWTKAADAGFATGGDTVAVDISAPDS